jgi:hypothetical protein
MRCSSATSDAYGSGGARAGLRNDRRHGEEGRDIGSGDTEIEKYFDMSIVLMPAEQALSGIGTTITSMETVGAPMAAHCFRVGVVGSP